MNGEDTTELATDEEIAAYNSLTRQMHSYWATVVETECDVEITMLDQS